MFGTMGSIVGFAGTFAPKNWAYCDGTLIPAQDSLYFQVVGNTYGGDGTTNAATPNLASFAPQSGPGVKKIICVNGDFTPGQTNTLSEVGQAAAVDRFFLKNYWIPCDGSVIDIGGSEALFSIVQNQYGGSLADKTFALPQLAAEPAQGTDQTVPYVLCRYGIYPSRGGGGSAPGSNPYDYLGQVQLFPFSFEIVGWLPCDGRLIDVTSNTQLYSLIGDLYGGDGVHNFALPKLQLVSSENGGFLTPMICVNGLYPTRY